MEVSPEDSVYTAILLLPAISRIKDGFETNRKARLALWLVLMNALLQMGVVQVINVYDFSDQLVNTQQLLLPSEVADYGDHDFAEHDKKLTEAQAKGQYEAHKATLLPNERKELVAAEEIAPLCHRNGSGDASLSCSPYSVKFMHEWDELDTNKDGVWTREEAQKDKAGVKKKLHGVSPETIFNNLINGLRMSRTYSESRGRNRTLYLAPDVDNEQAIPKAYFNYWMGDAMMCTHFDSSSCEAAAKDGVFEGALHPGRVSADAKGIHDLDSAIQYCYRMLNPGGGCETLLPTDFKSNREQRWGRCGTRSLVEGGKYTNPYDPDQSVHILTATYGNVMSYERATSRLFLFFLALILMLWLLNLIDEWRELIKFAEFLIAFPGLSTSARDAFTAGGEELSEKDGDGDTQKSYRITGISRKHRFVLTLVFIMRLMVALRLSQFGTKFLLVETNYLNLVLNSLALTFVLTIDSMLYALMEKKVIEELNSCKPIKFETRLPTEGMFGYFLKKECWGLFLVPIMSVCLVLYFNYRDKEPVLTALKCACIQEGDQCIDSMKYQTDWWKNYWSHILPSAMHQIEALRVANQ